MDTTGLSAMSKMPGLRYAGLTEKPGITVSQDSALGGDQTSICQTTSLSTQHFFAYLHLPQHRKNSVSLPPSDQELARWFAEEVQPHERPLRSYLCKSLPSAADAEDVMQDTYSKLLQAKGREIIQSPKKLLFAIARNVVRDFIRQRARVTIEPIAENTRMPVLNEKAGVVESICREQEIALLNEAIDALPERCREVIILRKIQGLSQREIAHELGIAEHTVESLAVKGVHRIESYLRSKGMREGGPR